MRRRPITAGSGYRIYLASLDLRKPQSCAECHRRWGNGWCGPTDTTPTQGQSWMLVFACRSPKSQTVSTTRTSVTRAGQDVGTSRAGVLPGVLESCRRFACVKEFLPVVLGPGAQGVHRFEQAAAEWRQVVLDATYPIRVGRALDQAVSFECPQ